MASAWKIDQTTNFVAYLALTGERWGVFWEGCELKTPRLDTRQQSPTIADMIDKVGVDRTCDYYAWSRGM